MFGFLKEKLKSAISSFTKKADKEAKEAAEEEPKHEEAGEEDWEKKELEEKGGLEKEARGEEKPELEEAEEEKEKEKAEEELEEAEEAEKAEEKLEEEPEEEKGAEPEEAGEKTEEAKGKEEELREKAEEAKEEQKKDGFFTKLRRRITGREAEKKIEEKKEEAEEEEGRGEGKAEEAVARKGVISRIREAVATTRISEKKFEELFWDLEVALLENNVAVEAIDKIKNDLKKAIVEKPIARGKVESTIKNTLRLSLKELLSQEKVNLIEMVRKKKPFVICFFGVNGSGKTTTIAKVAKMLQDKKLSVVLAAADTFRAAAIDQLERHADILGAKLIKHDYGADAAAVAFDAVKHAKARGKDAVLIDTAGRQHSNTNLMDELKKVVRVAKPDMKVFIGESITGNDCVEQAKKFNDAVGIDAIILTKADVDEKGGAAISVSYVTKKPIIYLGTGQQYDDLEAFSQDNVLKSIGLAA